MSYDFRIIGMFPEIWHLLGEQHAPREIGGAQIVTEGVCFILGDTRVSRRPVSLHAEVTDVWIDLLTLVQKLFRST